MSKEQVIIRRNSQKGGNYKVKRILHVDKSYREEITELHSTKTVKELEEFKTSTVEYKNKMRKCNNYMAFACAKIEIDVVDSLLRAKGQRV